MRKGLTKTIATGNAAVGLQDKVREGDEARAPHGQATEAGQRLDQCAQGGRGFCASLSTARDLRAQARE
jgi:hypothetical protein